VVVVVLATTAVVLVVLVAVGLVALQSLLAMEQQTLALGVVVVMTAVVEADQVAQDSLFFAIHLVTQ
jgi:hypothetical protein